MEKNKISWARVSKNICYFLVPFFGLILIACVMGLVIIDTDIEVEETTNYYDTRLFSSSYFSSIEHYFYRLLADTQTSENADINSEEKLEVSNEEESASLKYAESIYEVVSSNANDIQENVDINGKKGIIYYNTNTSNNFKYLMIDTKRAIAVTNLEHTMRTDSIEEIKQAIGENTVYWNFQEGEVDTNISHLSIEEIR